MTADEVARAASWGGAEGMRNTIVNSLSGLEAAPLSRLAQRLGQLAGGSEALLSLAVQAGEQLQLRGNRIYDAIPALRVLSELAIQHRQSGSF